MKKWRVVASVVASKYLGEFEAETKEQAEAMAARRAYVSICHQCSDEVSDPEITDIVAEEVEE